MPDMRIRVHTETLEANLRKVFGDKVKSMLTDDVKRVAAEIYRDCVEYYVPEHLGNLRGSTNIVRYKGTYAVEYNAEDGYGSHYAHAQYSGNNRSGMDASKWKRANPHTYSHWNQHMTKSDRDTFYELVKEMMIERANNG